MPSFPFSEQKRSPIGPFINNFCIFHYRVKIRSSQSPCVQRRDNLRTDRRIVLRTCAYTFPWIKVRSWLIRLLRGSFFGGKVQQLHMVGKTGIFIVVEMRQRSFVGVLKKFLMWHPPLLKSTNKIRGGMDATIEAYTR